MSGTLPDLLLARATSHPDQHALVCADATLTMRQLAAYSTLVAERLLKAGVRRGACVALFIEPSLELMLGTWGTLFAGGAYVPVSPDYPLDRVRFMLADSRAEVILCHEPTSKKLRELARRGTRIVTLASVGASRAELRVGQELERESGLRPQDLAYVIYTSGSTGKPKGAMIEHKSIVSQMMWLRSAYGISERTVILQKTPASFDAAQWEILAPACGSTVVMATPGAHRNVREIIRLIQKHDVTALQCVPTLLQALVDADEFRNCTSLTQIFSGGEALTRQLARNCIEALPGCQLVNLYGPTECTINSSAYTVDSNTLDGTRDTVSIGTPVHNTAFHILDGSLSPVEVGDIGELFISGVQVGRGYLHQPDLTAERFIDNPLSDQPDHTRLYRTGDLVRRNADGTIHFVGRSDNQVKVRGHRIELDEIRAATESLEWVKHAGVLVKTDPGSNRTSLLAFVELNPKKAVLMDQGVHGAHHQSKECKAQVKAQLSNPGCREPAELAGKAKYWLPGQTPTQAQRRLVFERKTYRFYQGGVVRKADILKLLATQDTPLDSRTVEELTFVEFGEIVRYLGQFSSDQRLLPKYGYASPGALYATQVYFELSGVGELPSGIYYYDPAHHHLYLIGEQPVVRGAQIKLHFVGKRRAIESIYKKNILEVLEIEVGHIVGLLERVLSRYGLSIGDRAPEPAVMRRLEVDADDYYLGTFELGSGNAPRIDEVFDVYVQAHPGMIVDLPAGQYRYSNGSLQWISHDLIRKSEVIAINQAVYERASLGITVIARTSKAAIAYVDLGRKLQHLQMNDIGLGFMSSGYSSKSGNDLPSARRIAQILEATGRDSGPSYFFVGGRISPEQLRSEGMMEDAVHMKGPAEMLKDTLAAVLPHFMVPDRVVVLDQMPLTANGKIDITALREREISIIERPLVKARTESEGRLCELWSKVLARPMVSVQDDFFEIGGTSLIAVELVHRINAELGTSLPLQALHEAPTIEELAWRVSLSTVKPSSRLIHLSAATGERPIYMWPGLGGATMSLRPLAQRMGGNRPFYGVQAHGLNLGEIPFSSIQEMALKDAELIRTVQPSGPYSLWGYSFGARVAFETAFQMEQAGERVENLVLIAPGSPRIPETDMVGEVRSAAFSCPVFVSMLYSVFAGGLDGPTRIRCLRATKDMQSFSAFVGERFPQLGHNFTSRVIDLVMMTYEFGYEHSDLLRRRINAPINVFRALGDQVSFIDRSAACLATAPNFVDLTAGHYAVLRNTGIKELIVRLKPLMGAPLATPHLMSPATEPQRPLLRFGQHG